MYTFGNLLEEVGVTVDDRFPHHIPIILPGDNTPREHQISGINNVLSYDRFGLYDEQGTGKSFIAQATAVIEGCLGNKTLAMMPPVLIPQFHRTLMNTFKGIDKKLTISRYEGDPVQRQRLIDKWASTQQYPDILLMTYEIFRQEGLILFQDQPYFRVICDEAVPLREPTNNTYIALQMFMGVLGKRNLLLMTGTPAKNELTDLYGLIQMVTPGRYLNKKQFYAMHVDTVDIRVGTEERGRTIQKIVGYRNLDTLWRVFYSQARRVEKSQVLTLPEKLIVDFEVELEERHINAYRRIMRERILELPDGSIINAINASALRQTALQGILNPKKLGVKGPSAILDAVDELVSEIDGKVLVMAHYQESVALIAEKFKKKNPAVINGLTNNPDAEKLKFIEDPTCQMLIINYTSGGVGLDGLQSVCNYAIAAEPTGVPGDFDQAIDRLHRGGQLNNVTCYVLRVAGTYSATVTDQMRRKKTRNSEVVSRNELQNELFGDEP